MPLASGKLLIHLGYSHARHAEHAESDMVLTDAMANTYTRLHVAGEGRGSDRSGFRAR